MSDEKKPPQQTSGVTIRVADPIWEAYGRVCARLDTNRSADLKNHIVRQIQDHGDAQDLADLDRGLQQVAERQSRMSPGRPRKKPAS